MSCPPVPVSGVPRDRLVMARNGADGLVAQNDGTEVPVAVANQ